MSVINQMLEDLEKRRSSNKQTNFLADMEPQTSLEAEGGSYSRVIKILLISGVVAFLGVALLKSPLFQKGVANAQDKVTVTPPARALAPPVTNPPPVAGVSPKIPKNLLTQISLTQAATTRLQLRFKQAVHYEVQDKLDLGIWQVTFDNTEISSTVTPVTVTNTLIKTLETHPISGKLQLRLTFLRPTHIQSMMIEHDNDAQFLIEIEPRKETLPPEGWQLPLALEEIVPFSPAVRVQPIKIKRVLSGEEKSEELFQEGLFLIEREEFEAATLKLNESLTVWPEHTKAREARVKLALRLGYLLEAEQHLEAGLLRAPSYLPFIKLKARLLLEEKQQGQALQLLVTHEKLGNSDPEYLNFMAALYREAGDPARAISLYKQALRRESHNWRGQMGLAIALEEQGELAEALEVYKRVETNSELGNESRKFVRNRIRILGKR